MTVVLLDHPAAGVARLLINRPDKRNAIDHDVRQALRDHLAALAADDGTRALVLGGVGGIFSAGGDLPSMAGLDDAGARDRMRHIHGLCRAIATAPFPIVSAIEGVAAGGAVGMALLGDRIVVEDEARILFPFLGLGLTPDWGQLMTLPQRVGIGPARRLLASGDSLSGNDACRIGLADVAAARGEAMGTAIAKAVALATLPIDAFVRTRLRLNGGLDMLEAEFQAEERDQAACLTGAEFAEGFAAFRGKYRPDFTSVRRG